MDLWRRNRILEKVAVDPGYDPGGRAGLPSIPSLFSRKFGDQNPAVARYNRALSTPTPLDPYIGQYAAKGPTIGEPGSPTSVSSTARDVATTDQNFNKTLEGNLDRRLRRMSSQYDSAGLPLSGMRSTTPELLQWRQDRAALYRPDFRPLGAGGYRSGRAPTGPGDSAERVYDFGDGRVAVGPVDLDTAAGRLGNRAQAMSDRFRSAAQASAPVLDARLAGETDPFVQSTPFQRFSSAVGRRMTNPGAAQKFQSTQDAVVEQIKRDLPSFLGGRTEPQIRADRVVREAKRQSPGGYWLDNALRMLPGTYGSAMPNPLGAVNLISNAVEGAERPFRNAANRNYLERVYGRGSPQASDQAVTLRSLQSYQDQAERAQAVKRRLLGPVDQAIPLSMVPVPGLDSPANVAAGFAPLSRLGTGARAAATGAQFLGSPVGITSTLAQGLAPRPGQSGRQYARELIPNVAPDVALGQVMVGDETPNLTPARNSTYGNYRGRVGESLRNR